MQKFITVLAVLLTLGVIAWACDLYRAAGLLLYTEQFLAGMVAIAIPLVFLHLPAKRNTERTGRVPWYDLLAAVAGFVCCIYIIVRYPVLSTRVPMVPTDGLIVAAIMFVLFLEGLRRTSGITLPIVVLGFVVLAMAGPALPGLMQGRPVPLDRLVYYLTWDATAILGVPMLIVTTVVIAFVFFGNVLFRAGGSTFFTDISMALMGRYRGGPAKISIVASSLFGTISGSVVANVVATGVVTIPMMKNAGYRAQVAGAVEATASTGGQLMPPVMGIAAFLMAEFLEVKYRDVAIAALIPAILYYVGLFIQADLEAVRMGISRVPEDRIPRVLRVLRAGWFFPIPFAVLIVALFVLDWSPETAALSAALVILVAAFVFKFEGKRLTPVDVLGMLKATGLSVLELFMIGAAAGMVIGVLNITGQGFGLTLSMVHLAGGNIFSLLVLAGIACIILGMGMPTVGVYILLATLVAPALIEMKIPPMAAHMFILYYGMLSMITPPVAIGAFAAANIAKAPPMRTGFEAMRFGWVAFVIPFLFVFSGTLLMYGDPVHIFVDFVAAVVGIWLFSAAMMGHAFRPLAFQGKVIYAAAGACLLIPLEAFGGGRWVNLVGAALAILIFAGEFAGKRRKARAGAMP